MSSDSRSYSGAPAAHGPLGALVLGAIGVVYGDIGTSVLYTLKEVFGSGHVPFTPANVYGVLSIVFWTLTIIVSLKYVTLVLRADNHGEGGLVAMLALASQSVKDKAPALRKWMLLIGIFGTCLFYGDGVITPAITVLSAVEGLDVVSPAFRKLVIPLTLAILCFLGVLAFHFPEYLTTPQLRKSYDVTVIRNIMLVAMAIAGGIQGLPQIGILHRRLGLNHGLFGRSWLLGNRGRGCRCGRNWLLGNRGLACRRLGGGLGDHLGCGRFGCGFCRRFGNGLGLSLRCSLPVCLDGRLGCGLLAGRCRVEFCLNRCDQKIVSVPVLDPGGRFSVAVPCFLGNRIHVLCHGT